jgi:mannose-6-phosphate isomerase-like protein (cupin superfamily)
VISPGPPHRVVNTGGGDLRFPCCGGPPYSGEDTVFSARAERE